jgi:hypothetical protein
MVATEILSESTLSVVAGVSTLFGVIALCAYLYFYSLASKKTSSLRTIIEGEGLFNSDQITSVLNQFKDDRNRLAALQRLARLDQEKASRLISKINDNVDVAALSSWETRKSTRYSLATGIIFLAFAVTALISSRKEIPSDPTAELRTAFSSGQTNADFETALSNLDLSTLSSNGPHKEASVKELASLLVHWRPHDDHDQTRDVRNHIIDLIRKNAAFPFYTYFEQEDFAKADLVDADFSGTSLKALHFTDAFAPGANFSNSYLVGVSFQGASLRDADFNGATVDNSTHFDNSDWYNTRNLTPAQLSEIGVEHLMPCPATINGFIEKYDGTYDRYKFNDQDESRKTELKEYWGRLISEEGLCHRLPH